MTTDAREAASGSHVLYTDVWASMGQESESQARAVAFAPYALDATLLALAADDAIVLHCLPAHRGEEIAAEVIDGPRSRVFDQAEKPPARAEGRARSARRRTPTRRDRRRRIGGDTVSSRSDRLDLLRALLADRDLRTHEEVRVALADAGHMAHAATIGRDPRGA